MESASFFLQTRIFFGRTAKIAWREKCWKYIVFAIIASSVVVSVIRKDIFKTYEDTKSGFFTIVCVAIWLGIFNSIQIVCKEHNVIKDECRIGMKVSAYITAHCMWQAILCFMQAVIICSISFKFIEFNTEGIFFSSAYLEYFITVYLITFGSDVMGLMISSLANEASMAMTIMPFVLILQLIMSGVLFKLKGFSKQVANFTFSRWGMSACGTIADLNNDKYPLKVNVKYPEVRKLEDDPTFEYVSRGLIKAWVYLILLMIGFYILSIICLKIKNRD